MAKTEERKRLNRKFEWVVRECVTKCLRRHGFNQTGRYYWRDCDPTVAFGVYVDKLRQWGPSECTFRLECGMVAHVLPLMYEKLAPNWVPNPVVGQIRVHPGELVPTIGSHFVIPSGASDDELAALAKSITRILEDVVLPWYSKFRTARDVGEYILSPGDEPGKSWIEDREIKHHPDALRRAAIAFFGAGDDERALSLLDLADRSNDRIGQHLTDDLRERIERLRAKRKASH